MGDLSKRLREVDYDTLVCDAEDVMTLIAKAADALEWQPITEAPTGHSAPSIDIWCGSSGRIPDAFWGKPSYGGDACWVYVSGYIPNDGVELSPVPNPTHFMPLPQPPEGE